MNAMLSRAAYEDANMTITFPDAAPQFDGANLTLRFTAAVDGEQRAKRNATKQHRKELRTS